MLNYTTQYYTTKVRYCTAMLCKVLFVARFSTLNLLRDNAMQCTVLHYSEHFTTLPYNVLYYIADLLHNVSLYYNLLHYTALAHLTFFTHFPRLYYIVSVLGRDKGYTVKYNPLPSGVPEGEAQGNS